MERLIYSWDVLKFTLSQDHARKFRTSFNTTPKTLEQQGDSFYLPSSTTEPMSKDNSKAELTVVAHEPVDLNDSFGDAKKASKTTKDNDVEEDGGAAAATGLAAANSSLIDKTEETKDYGTDVKKFDGDAEEKNTVTPNAEKTSDGKMDDAETPPPPPPPRPVSPRTQIKKDLKEAFPDIEEKLITAVLIASQGAPDPAFNALLYISDPTFEPEIPAAAPVSAPVRNDLTDDELLARKLQKEFEKEERQRRASRSDRRKRERERRSTQGQHITESDDDDDFGQIKETFTQGIEEARTTLNGWVSGLAKKFQDPADKRNDEPVNKQTTQNGKLFGALGGSSLNFNKSKTNTNFDKDPEIITNDFGNKIKLADNDSATSPALPARKQDQKSASLQQHSSFGESKKWQPLNSDVPLDSNAFLVTDSEDEEAAAATTTTDFNKKEKS